MCSSSSLSPLRIYIVFLCDSFGGGWDVGGRSDPFHSEVQVLLVCLWCLRVPTPKLIKFSAAESWNSSLLPRPQWPDYYNATHSDSVWQFSLSINDLYTALRLCFRSNYANFTLHSIPLNPSCAFATIAVCIYYFILSHSYNALSSIVMWKSSGVFDFHSFFIFHPFLCQCNALFSWSNIGLVESIVIASWLKLYAMAEWKSWHGFVCAHFMQRKSSTPHIRMC